MINPTEPFSRNDGLETPDSGQNRIFKDPMTTMAAIDRVVHHSVVLDLMAVDSYRAEAAGAKSKTRAAKETAEA